MLIFYRKCPGDRIRLILDRSKLILQAGKPQDIDGRVVGAEKVHTTAHRLSRADKFEIKYQATQTSGKILFLTGNVARQKLQFLLLVADDVGHEHILVSPQFSDLKMAIDAVAVDVFDVWTRIGRLYRHFPLGVGQRKAVVDIWRTKRLVLRNRRRSQRHQKQNREQK